MVRPDPRHREPQDPANRSLRRELVAEYPSDEGQGLHHPAGRPDRDDLPRVLPEQHRDEDSRPQALRRELHLARAGQRVEPPEEPLECQGGPGHVDQPDLGPALVLERVGRARRGGDRLTPRPRPPLAAAAHVERPGHHRVALLRVWVDVQGRPPKPGASTLTASNSSPSVSAVDWVISHHIPIGPKSSTRSWLTDPMPLLCPEARPNEGRTPPLTGRGGAGSCGHEKPTCPPGQEH